MADMQDPPRSSRPRSLEPLIPERRSFIATAGLAVGCAAIGLAAPAALARSLGAAARRDFLPDGFESPFEWAEIRPGVFATANLASGGNCLAVAGGGAGLLVDTKFPAFARQIARDVKALTGSGVTHVLNSHHHADHSGGNIEFVESAALIAHANGLPRVRAQFERNLQGVTGGRRMAGRVAEPFREKVLADVASYLDPSAPPIEADSWVANTPVTSARTGIDLGGSWAVIRHFGRPSHTDNDLVLHLADRNVVHTGDLVFNNLHPYFDANGGASSAGWLETLAEIDALCDSDTVVVPGHGPTGDRGIVRAQIRYIEQLREAVQQGIDAGTPLDELRARTFPFMEGMGLENLRENAIVFVYNELTSG